MNQLRTSARELVAKLGGAGSGSAGDIRRATLEVTVDGRVELVTVTVQPDGALLVAATDGTSDGAHVRAALRLLAGLAPDNDEPREPRESLLPPAAVETTRHPLGDALDELLLAIARHGVDSATHAASVNEAIERLIEVAGKAPPFGLARFVGRLRLALQRRDAALIARMLDGAARVAGMMRESSADPESRRVRAVWLGRPNDPDTPRDVVYDRSFVEVGREWIAGLSRASLQRRYLVCTTTGEVFREERLRSESGSVGSCPRLVTAGLAEIELGGAPRLLRLLQYAVTPRIGADVWARVGELAVPSVDELRPRFRAAIKASPALAEPFVVVAAREMDTASRVVDDGAGGKLPLRGGPAGIDARVVAAVESGTLRWVAGRVDDVEGVLVMEPFAVAVEVEGKLVFERLR
jgi:hypothetical protein